MSEGQQVVVLGGTGFIGSAVMRCLARRSDVRAVAVPAPRLRSRARDASALLAEAERHADRLDGVVPTGGVLVNASGIAEASCADADGLVGAHALLPAAALLAAVRGGARRFVQISSAAVQGNLVVLDESERRLPFSPYSLSKCLGEEVVLATDMPIERVVYRPPSVHGVDRAVTRRLASLARSNLRSVAGDGTRPSPQALVDNVAAAVVQLSLGPRPAPVVIHPWEGLNTGDVLELLGGGRRPRRVPTSLARWAVRTAWAIGRGSRLQAAIRRVELLWFGQRQAESWLTGQGWTPPVGRDGWRSIGDQLSSPSRHM